MNHNQKREVSILLADAERLLRNCNLNRTEKLTLQKLLEANYWLWTDDTDV
jgi:hypothetical protein